VIFKIISFESLAVTFNGFHALDMLMLRSYLRVSARVTFFTYLKKVTKEGLARGGNFWCLFLAVEEKTRARLLVNNYRVMKAFVRENLFS
jgi:hypothetical protein